MNQEIEISEKQEDNLVVEKKKTEKLESKKVDGRSKSILCLQLAIF